jgi:flavin-dependent dehydrogenase
MANVGMIQGIGSSLTSGVIAGYNIANQKELNQQQNTYNDKYLSAMSSAYGNRR